MKTILYGAFGRHNFGDMLFPYVLKSLFDKHSIKVELEYCDLISKDMTIHGGHDVKSITDFFETDFNVASRLRNCPSKASIQL